MFGSLDVSTSALVAQRTRLNAISANIAGAHAITNDQGEYDPFRRRVVVFAQGDGHGGEGVHVKEIQQQAAFRKVYEPENPFADAKGYVNYPEINSAVEQINAMEAMRAYEANITTAQATKSMLQSSLRLLA